MVARKVVRISQETRKVTGGVSVIYPNNGKRLTFVGNDAVGCHRVDHGRQKVVMKALHLSNDPFTVETCGNLFVRKDTFVSHIGRLDNLQYVVYYESMKREVKTRPMYECR